MVDIQTVSVMLASASVIAGVVYYALQIRHQTRMRKTDLLMRIYSTGTSIEFMDAFWKVSSLQVKDYQDYVKQYGPLFKMDNPMNRALFTVASYYELVGILLYRKLIDLVTVYDVWGSGNPIALYEKIKPVLLGVRKRNPDALVAFEYLCVELKRREPELKKALNEALGKMHVPE